ncbi:PIG-L deacetylase family protein [Pseudomonas akapageensis]|uniref:PIG-L deacetylase family protein n=1 Tax=Pseudomonas akapageensis TaxID=2609961 RepID=UPI0014093070|nr:PIG-L family deacetylase [Pseudomonas akapageensis]
MKSKNESESAGTSLSQWQSSPLLQRVPYISVHELVPPGHRLVVIAPHPDDEVLGCGGLLAMMAGREADLLMVTVTDGDASHPGSRLWPPARLRDERPLESQRSLACLGLDVASLQWHRLGLADSRVQQSEDELCSKLVDMLRSGDRVLTTWRHDAHSDHEAVGRACANAVQLANAVLLEVPVWAWHWAAPQDPRVPWQRARKLALDSAILARKHRAVSAHSSQLQADSDTGAPAALPPYSLERLVQPFELIFL